MKKIFTLLLLIAAIGANAQILIKIKSKSALADSIWINRGAAETPPIPNGSSTDTVRSWDYKLCPNRDTLQIMNVIVNYYNKSGSLMMTDYLQIPQSLFNRWKVLLNALDAYIVAQRKRINKL